MAQVLAASFGTDKLFRIMFPYQDEFPDDLVTAFRRKLRESWWDYSKVLMVSYETHTSNAENPDDEKHLLVTTRKGQKEVITGMVEWQRIGLGWEHVWNLWGLWDPSKSLPTRSLGLWSRKHRVSFQHWDFRGTPFPWTREAPSYANKL